MQLQPLAEVYGFPIDNLSPTAERFRRTRLCPFNNKVPSCTKDRASDPLGVCSVFLDSRPVITCPIRFREDWIIIEDAASFFFPPNTAWTSLQEVTLDAGDGRSAGNIDFVVVSYDGEGKITDFGSIEVQAVYISGNVRRPFEYYMSDRARRSDMKWSATSVRPDFLSSSRKRLAPQMIAKGGILKAWGKKQAVVLQDDFFHTLPTLPEVARDEADMVWLIYRLDYDNSSGTYKLARSRQVYTRFEPAMQRITSPVAGSMERFIELLQEKLDDKFSSTPDTRALLDEMKESD
jgi:hypothetical protein